MRNKTDRLVLGVTALVLVVVLAGTVWVVDLIRNPSSRAGPVPVAPPGGPVVGTGGAKRVTRVVLPDGAVKIEFLSDHQPPAFRITVAGTQLEGDRVFIGDGTVAVELLATPRGFRFDTKAGDSRLYFRESYGNLRGGSLQIDGGYWTAAELPPGSVYVVARGIRLE
jgi:hypothetical protein